MKRDNQNIGIQRRRTCYRFYSAILKALSLAALIITVLFPTHLFAANCTLSPYVGKATLNEFFKDNTTQANSADDFAELRILDNTITSAIFDTWKVQICERSVAANNNDEDGCNKDAGGTPTYISVSNFSTSNLPWLVLKDGTIGKHINLKTGFDAILLDNGNNVIDYVTVDGYGQAESNLGCTVTGLPYDFTASSPGASDKFIYRTPDGTGDWDSAPSATAPPSEDDTNDTAPDGGTLPTISVADVTINKGTTATFIFTMSKSVNYAVSVDYKTTGGTAVSNVTNATTFDYTDKTGTVTFAANTTFLTTTIDISTNSTSPSTTGTVYFNFHLFNQVNATIKNAYPIGTILGNASSEWYMDEAAWNNTANQVSDINSTNHGTPFFDVTTTSDPKVLCRAGSFDGSNDYIEIPHNASLVGTNQLTYSVWIKPTSWSNSNINQIMAKSDLDGGAKKAQMGIFSETRDISGTDTTVLIGRAETAAGTKEVFATLPTAPTTSWTHVVLVFNDNSLTLYINGVVASNIDASFPSSTIFNTTTLLTASNALMISKHLSDAKYYFNGHIDEVLVMQSSLPAAFIKTMYDYYNAGKNWDGTARTCPSAVDHFSINYSAGASGTGVNCQAEAITITAHNSSHATVTTFTGSVNLTTSTTNGDWTKTSTASDAQGTLTAGASDSGAASYAFVGADNGSVILNFKDTHVETANINITNGTITETSNSAVAADDYQIAFSATGFNFLADTVKDTIGVQIGGKRSDIAPGSQSLELAAVKTNTTTGACESAFAGSTAVEVAFECIDPVNCTGDKLYLSTDGGTTFDQMDGTPELTYTSITDFDFGNATDTTAPIIIRYDDVGKIKLHARKTITPSNEVMSGSSNEFVVRPFAFYPYITGNPAATSSAGAAFTTAGTDFTVNVKAVLWQSADDDANPAVGTATDGLSDANDGIADGHELADTNPANNTDLSNNTVANNYGQEVTTEQVLLQSLLNQPSGGNDPVLDDSSTNGKKITSFTVGTGIGTSTTINYDEVGIIEIYTKVNDSDYLGIGTTETAKIVGRSGYVGRFYPHHFETDITHACSNTFTYSGQPFITTVYARNLANSTTKNYRDAFAYTGVTLSDANPAATPTGAFTNNTIGSASFSSDLATNGSSFGVGSTEAANNFTYTFTNKDTIPDTLEIRATDNKDGSSSNGYTEDSTEIRSGRMRLENVFGSELTALTMPVKVEYYSNNSTATLADDGFVLNTNDSCTNYDATAGTLTNYTENLSSGETTLTGAGTTVNGVSSISFSAPGTGNEGSVNLLAGNISSWLTYNWNIDCDNADADNDITTGIDTGLCGPAGIASFGLYRGDDRIIYWREVF